MKNIGTECLVQMLYIGLGLWRPQRPDGCIAQTHLGKFVIVAAVDQDFMSLPLQQTDLGIDHRVLAAAIMITIVGDQNSHAAIVARAGLVHFDFAQANSYHPQALNRRHTNH